VRVRTAGLLLLGFLMVVAAPAGAQSRGRSDRNELTVFGGVSLTDLSSTSRDGPPFLLAAPFELSILPTIERSATLGGSAEFGVRYGRRLSDALTVEGDFSVAPGHDLEERIGFGCPPELLCITQPAILVVVPDILRTDQLVAYHYGGGVRLALTRGSVRPSVVGGLGAVTYDGSRIRETRLAVRVGAGIEATVNSLSTRLEVLDVIVADHFVTGRAEHDVHVRVGVGVRW